MIIIIITGVLFDDLTVRGYGGIKHKIKTFPNAFVDFFNVYGTFKELTGRIGGTEVDILRNFKGIVRPGEMVSGNIRLRNKS